ncbi:MAG: DUF2510 domain-containing protein [Ilumatobacteraceae bacterium]
MYEFDSVSVSTYEASSLAATLTEKSGEGWDVVAVVPTGSEITAFLKRASPADDAEATETPAVADAPSTTSSWDNGAAAAAAATEPAGWGTAPDAGATTSPAATGSSWGSDSAASSTSGWGATAAAAPAAAAPATPSVPAGWYSDPAGRFELRYWDGSAWTEHVSRAGQQYTDPPVA